MLIHSRRTAATLCIPLSHHLGNAFCFCCRSRCPRVGPAGPPSHSYLGPGHQFGVFSPLLCVLKCCWSLNMVSLCVEQSAVSLDWVVGVVQLESLPCELRVSQSLLSSSQKRRKQTTANSIQHWNKLLVPAMPCTTLSQKDEWQGQQLRTATTINSCKLDLTLK